VITICLLAASESKIVTIVNTQLQYSQRHSVINHCDRHITLLSGTDISFGLLVHIWGIASNTLNTKEILKIYFHLCLS